jgi:nitroreductase
MGGLLQIIKERRSIRAFQKKEVENEKVEQLLESARWAPSAGNLQPRAFIVIKDPVVRYELSRAALYQDFIAQAPLVMVACSDFRRSQPYGERGKLYAIEDCSASIQNMLLMAHALGLGACWVGAFVEEEVRELLSLPDHVLPLAIIPIGYPDEEPRAPPKDLDVRFEGW